MRAYSTCNVLLIDDDPAALDSLQALLSASQPAMDAANELFHLVHVNCLSRGLEALTDNAEQIVLLDLNLPDSQGIETLKRLRQTQPTVPTLVLTGMDDDVVPVQAIELGAQGFLSKDNLEPNLLAYALLLALKRQHQLRGAAVSFDATQSLARDSGDTSDGQSDRTADEVPVSEIESFERLASSVRPSVITSGLFESGLLQASVPEIWRGLAETYAQILDQSFEQKIFRVEHPISGQLRSLAEQLGFLKAGARDVVELHTLVLRQKSETENALKTKVYAAEGRLIVLELMGYLATYYRKYFIGLSKMNTVRTGEQTSDPSRQGQATS